MSSIFFDHHSRPTIHSKRLNRSNSASSNAPPSPYIVFEKDCSSRRSSFQIHIEPKLILYQQEIPLPNGGMLARRTGKYLCVADRENYNIINLESAEMLPLLPLSQAFDSPAIVKPLITVISDTEFLILSWTGTASLGLFITGEGEPVRGTLEWPSHPESLGEYHDTLRPLDEGLYTLSS